MHDPEYDIATGSTEPVVTSTAWLWYGLLILAGLLLGMLLGLRGIF